MLLRQAGPDSVTDGPERALGFLAPFYTSAERSALRLTRTGQGPPPNPLPPTLRLTEANRTGAPRHAPAKELQWPGGQGGGGGGDGITATTFFLSSPSHSLSRSNSSSPLSPILPSSPSRSIDERIDRTPASIAMSVANRSLRTLRIQNPQRLAALAGAAARPSASFGAARCSASPSLSSSTRTFSSSVAKQSGAPAMASSAREYDPEIKDIADYVANKPIDSELAFDTARWILLDTLGCGLEGLRFKECAKLLGPIVPGTVVPNGTKVPGTPFVLDPVNGAFNIGAMIRWLDFNDCWLAAEWGHPSDNLGAILAVADWVNRTNKAGGNLAGGKVFTVKDVLEAMIKAHEIQGCLALLNSFNKVGLDHVVLVKVASTAVVSKMLGLSEKQIADAVTQAWVDGQSLRTYRHSPNTMSRKSWAAGDACQRAVNLALKVMKGEQGVPTVLSAPTWGFYDVLFKGKKFEFQRPYGSYVMENVLFKVSYPAEFHSQTAVEASEKIYHQLKAMGKSAADIKAVTCRTHEACIRIIDKQFKPMDNFADRDHCIQYMCSVMLTFGRLEATDYTDGGEAATSELVESLRKKIKCVEDPQYTQDYHDPKLRTISNALTVELNDGTVLDEVAVEAPLGHRLRRDEAKPVILAKYKRHLGPHLPEARVKELVELSQDSKKLESMSVDEYVDLYTVKESKFL
ncbi:2-methylcitrate dehydratase [Purpureocillium lilacinum]|uniref:2-methylcitrate dehydratase n=3 Tax=Purpureocillium lilacinum TaxID=33203 RepID=A0A2U3E9G0_PURLI|nr:2-methylcitrate dehydratase [Purpureocillium lilacinum]